MWKCIIFKTFNRILFLDLMILVIMCTKKELKNYQILFQCLLTQFIFFNYKEFKELSSEFIYNYFYKIIFNNCLLKKWDCLL